MRRRVATILLLCLATLSIVCLVGVFWTDIVYTPWRYEVKLTRNTDGPTSEERWLMWDSFEGVQPDSTGLWPPGAESLVSLEELLKYGASSFDDAEAVDLQAEYWRKRHARFMEDWVTPAWWEQITAEEFRAAVGWE